MRRVVFILLALILVGFSSPVESIGMLDIPSIGLSQPVYPVGRIKVPGGESYQVLPDGVGWHDDTARPGEVGNTVINGHNPGVFGGLGGVVIGDSLTLAGRTYLVTKRLILNERGATTDERIANARYILPTEDKRVTLVTCYGPDDGQRLIVIAKPED